MHLNELLSLYQANVLVDLTLPLGPDEVPLLHLVLVVANHLDLSFLGVSLHRLQVLRVDDVHHLPALSAVVGV